MGTFGASSKLKTKNLTPLQLQVMAELETRRRLRMSQPPEEAPETGQRSKRVNPYQKYEHAPVQFGREVLGENYTDDVIKVFRSVRDNQVTIARSANGTGKTHGAARIASWFYKVFEDSQVYTTCPPPR